jgi:hypothetical protein
MVPSGQELRRTLTCSRLQPEGERTQIVEFDTYEATRISAQYARRLSASDPKAHKFQDVFLGSTPVDVGGAGRYIHLTTLMGSASAYTERFRGEDDQAGQLERVLRAADGYLAYAKGWLSAELRQHPGHAKLLAFCDGPLRRDMHNLVMYAGLADKIHPYDENAYEEMGVRMLQYLSERGHFSMEEIPAIAYAFYRADVDDRAHQLMALIQRRIARVLGVPDSKPVPEALAFLNDSERAWKSFLAYLETTAAYQKLLGEWEQRRVTQPKKPRPAPDDLLDAHLKDLIFFELGPHDQLNVSLQVPVQPFATNGSWNTGEKKVEWLNRAMKKRSGLPAFLYAYWSLPADNFQKKHFGKVVLSGRDLGDYVLWRSGLPAAKGIAWDDFLRSLKPGASLSERLASFRFPDEKKPDPKGESRSLADIPRRLIDPGLSGKQEDRD